MFSPDEKWVLMHIAAAGGEKIAWLPIKAAWHWKQEKCMDFLLRVPYGIETSFMFFVFFGRKVIVFSAPNYFPKSAKCK